jgi:hypothetical protein
VFNSDTQDDDGQNTWVYCDTQYSMFKSDTQHTGYDGDTQDNDYQHKELKSNTHR